MSKSFLYTLFPWNFITKFHEGVVIQKDGLIQRSFAYRAPDLDSAGEAEVNALCIRVNDFAKRLGSGWSFFVEAQRFHTQEYPKRAAGRTDGFDTLAGYLIDKEREAAFSSIGKHFESSYYLTFVWRPPNEGIKKLTSLFVQSSSSKDNGKGIKDNVNYFINETNAIIGIISSNMLIEPLTNEETLCYLHSTVSMNRIALRFPHNAILLDRILSDTVLINTMPMQLGEYFIPIIGVNDFPEETYPDILDALNRARMEYRWVTRYICQSKEDAKKEAQKKEKAHRGSKKSFLQTFAEATSKDGAAGSTNLNHGASVKEEDSILAGVEIENDIASLGYLTSCVMVWDKDLAKAKKKAEMVRNIIQSAGFTCKEETFNANESWRSMMPGQVYANFRSLPVMSYNLSHFVPLSSVWSGQLINVHAGNVTGVNLPHVTCTTLEGNPFYLNLNPKFSQSSGDVGHTSIFGPTGAGKSTIIGILAAQFFKYPNSLVICFDKGKSIRQLCLSCGGLFYEPAADSFAGVSLQPLRDLENDRDMQDAQDFIESLCTVTGNTVTPLMGRAIKESLDLLQHIPPERRTITSFLQYCSYNDPASGKNTFYEILGDYIYAGGKYGKIFDSAASGLSLDTRFLAIEMEDLMNRGEGCVVPALIYLFNLVEKKFDGRLTLLILDEAWLFLRNEIFSAKISEWLKVLRKKNVFVVFATQDVADVAKSPLKTTIIQQCLTKIYLADPSAYTEGMMPIYRSFGLSDTEIALISGAQMKRDYFYTSPIGRRLFQLDLGPLTLALIGAANHGYLDDLVIKKGFSVPLCRDILEHKRINYRQYIHNDAPQEIQIKPDHKPVFPTLPVFAPPVQAVQTTSFITPLKIPAQDILNAAAQLQNRSGKGEGRSAELMAKKLNIGVSTLYQAKKLLKYGDTYLLEQVKKGEITFKKAVKSLKQSESSHIMEETNAG